MRFCCFTFSQLCGVTFLTVNVGCALFFNMSVFLTEPSTRLRRSLKLSWGTREQDIKYPRILSLIFLILPTWKEWKRDDQPKIYYIISKVLI